MFRMAKLVSISRKDRSNIDGGCESRERLALAREMENDNFINSFPFHRQEVRTTSSPAPIDAPQRLWEICEAYAITACGVLLLRLLGVRASPLA